MKTKKALAGLFGLLGSLAAFFAGFLLAARSDPFLFTDNLNKKHDISYRNPRSSILTLDRSTHNDTKSRGDSKHQRSVHQTVATSTIVPAISLLRLGLRFPSLHRVNWKRKSRLNENRACEQAKTRSDGPGPGRAYLGGEACARASETAQGGERVRSVGVFRARRSWGGHKKGP